MILVGFIGNPMIFQNKMKEEKQCEGEIVQENILKKLKMLVCSTVPLKSSWSKKQTPKQIKDGNTMRM
jgi:hypothetical protein